MDERIAVTLRGRGEEKRRLFRQGKPERVMGAERPDLQRLDRQLEVIDRAGRRGEVENDVDIARDIEVLGHILLDEAVVRIAFEVVEVGGIARDEIVDADDPVALGQQAVGQVTSQKPGAAGDNCGFHEDKI
jgi:hypothetical protein